MSRQESTLKETGEFRQGRDRSQQYASTYYWRLARLRGPIESAAAKKWPSSQAASRVLDLPVGKGAWAVGTVYREMEAHPKPLDDLALIYHGVKPEEAPFFASDNDVVSIEDDYGRVVLQGAAIKTHCLPTGCVLAVHGVKSSDGILHVDDIVFAGAPPIEPVKMENATTTELSSKVLMLSGLLLDESKDTDSQLNLLTAFLQGFVGPPELSASISRVIIAGDSLAAPSPQLVGSRVTRPVATGAAVNSFGEAVYQISRAVPVVIMPGNQDPCTAALPQQPFHPLLLGPQCRSAVKNKLIELVPNPASLDIDGVSFLGHSGQPIADLQRYSHLPDHKLLERTLEWRHLAPTAPDTLCAVPFIDSDPFILESAPQVLFAGNQPEFNVTQMGDTKVVSIPRFSESYKAVLIDLQSLEVQAIEFDLTD